MQRDPLGPRPLKSRGAQLAGVPDSKSSKSDRVVRTDGSRHDNQKDDGSHGDLKSPIAAGPPRVKAY